MTRKNSALRHRERGSALTILLIGIALFAALAYVVTASLRVTDATSPAKEKMALAATDMMQFLESLRTRVQLMTTMDGVPLTRLNFYTDAYKLGNNTNNCWDDNTACTDEACRVFKPGNPAGSLPLIFKDAANHVEQTDAGRVMNGHGSIKQLSIDGVGTSAPELVYLINGVSPAFCNFYNAKQGITTTFTDATEIGDLGETGNTSLPENFGGCGNAAAFTSTNVFGDQATQFRGRQTFCSVADESAYVSRLAVYYVLKAR